MCHWAVRCRGGREEECLILVLFNVCASVETSKRSRGHGTGEEADSGVPDAVRIVRQNDEAEAAAADLTMEMTMEIVMWSRKVVRYWERDCKPYNKTSANKSEFGRNGLGIFIFNTSVYLTFCKANHGSTSASQLTKRLIFLVHDCLHPIRCSCLCNLASLSHFLTCSQ